MTAYPYRVEGDSFVCLVEADPLGRITFTAPLLATFVGQPLIRLKLSGSVRSVRPLPDRFPPLPESIVEDNIIGECGY